MAHRLDLLARPEASSSTGTDYRPSYDRDGSAHGGSGGGYATTNSGSSGYGAYGYDSMGGGQASGGGAGGNGFRKADVKRKASPCPP